MLQTLKRVIAPKAVIRDIHRSFDNAADKLLEEAKAIVGKNEVIEKGKRMERLGFSGAALVTKKNALLKTADTAALIERYRQWYPFNKFITEEMVRQICKKYNLLCGPSNNYRGDIPEKNLREIESFRLRREDENRGLFSFEVPTISINPATGALEVDWSFYRDQQRQFVDNPKFKICAPEKDFNTAGLEKRGFFLAPKDPIVLCPVKGGFLIVTKWGLESGDEIVRNEIEN